MRAMRLSDRLGAGGYRNHRGQRAASALLIKPPHGPSLLVTLLIHAACLVALGVCGVRQGLAASSALISCCPPNQTSEPCFGPLPPVRSIFFDLVDGFNPAF